MGNMSYCRFQNTLTDLRECEESITEELSTEEHKARTKLVKVCRQIVDAYDSGMIPDTSPEDELHG